MTDPINPKSGKSRHQEHIAAAKRAKWVRKRQQNPNVQAQKDRLKHDQEEKIEALRRKEEAFRRRRATALRAQREEQEHDPGGA